jgi:DedD protein
MSSSGKRGGGDRILESRHLVGLFLGVVLLCGVFFTLGYVMGHTQYDTSVHAADVRTPRPAIWSEPSPKSAPDAGKPAAPSVGEWDFYSKKPDDRLDSSPNPSSSASPSGSSPDRRPPRATEKPVIAPARMPAHFEAPHMLKNAIVLQIAALRRQGDAVALADELQQKRFPAFVVAPTAEPYYRVQVGPYSTEQAAEAAKRALDHQGFKAIIKR